MKSERRDKKARKEKRVRKAKKVRKVRRARKDNRVHYPLQPMSTLSAPPHQEALLLALPGLTMRLRTHLHRLL